MLFPCLSMWPRRYTWTEFTYNETTGSGLITRPGYWIVKNSYGTVWPNTTGNPHSTKSTDKVSAMSIIPVYTHAWHAGGDLFCTAWLMQRPNTQHMPFAQAFAFLSSHIEEGSNKGTAFLKGL